jgi:hypothetical protein
MRQVVIALSLAAGCWTQAPPVVESRPEVCDVAAVCACVQNRITNETVATLRRRIADKGTALAPADSNDPIVVELPGDAIDPDITEEIRTTDRVVFEDPRPGYVRTCVRARGDACAKTPIRCTE